jgi:hypothetical protein
VALGTQVTLQNSQCSVNVSLSAGAISGNSYTLQLPLTFAARYAGARNIYGYAASRNGLNSGWQNLGSWTVGAPSRCDPEGLGTPGVGDVQQIINEALGAANPVDDLNQDGTVNIIDAQTAINAVLGMPCLAQ